MNHEEQEFPAVNLRHPMIICFLILFIPLSIFFIWAAFSISNMWLAGLFFTISLFTPVLLYYSLNAKVIIDDHQVTKKTPFGSTALAFRDIRYFEVYKQEEYFAQKLYPEEYDKSSWFGVKFICLANRDDYNPMSFRQKGSIQFHYSQALYTLLKLRINACLENN